MIKNFKLKQIVAFGSSLLAAGCTVTTLGGLSTGPAAIVYVTEGFKEDANTTEWKVGMTQQEIIQKMRRAPEYIVNIDQERKGLVFEGPSQLTRIAIINNGIYETDYIGLRKDIKDSYDLGNLTKRISNFYQPQWDSSTQKKSILKNLKNSFD